MVIPGLDQLRAPLEAARRGELVPDDLYAVRELAEWHGVLPLLANALSASGGSIEARQWLAARQRDAVAREAAWRPETQRALERLAGAGVPALVLKGAHLAHAVYRLPHLRPHHDLDLLVPEASKKQAATALTDAGYRLVPHVRGDLILAQMHFNRESAAGIGHAIDLHWRALNPHPFRGLLPFDEVLDRSQHIAELGDRARGLSHVDALLLACAHLAAHHGAQARVIWLCDVDHLARRLDGREWAAFVERVRNDQVSAVVSDVLDASESVLGAEIPSSVKRALASHHAGERLTSAYLEPRSRAELLLLDLRAIEGWRDRAVYLKQHVWPDRDYMRGRYSARGAGMLWAYVRRAAGGAAGWLRRPE